MSEHEELAALIHQIAPAPAADPLQGFAADLIASQRSMDPDVAAALTPEARWDLYAGEPAPAADGEREELASALEVTGSYEIPSYEQLRRAAALLREARPQPVPVAERPWERPGWCDAEGRCWFGAPVAGAADAGWILRKPSERLSHQTTCLHHWAIPQPPQGGEMKA